MSILAIFSPNAAPTAFCCPSLMHSRQSRTKLRARPNEPRSSCLGLRDWSTPAYRGRMSKQRQTLCVPGRGSAARSVKPAQRGTADMTRGQAGRGHPAPVGPFWAPRPGPRVERSAVFGRVFIFRNAGSHSESRDPDNPFFAGRNRRLGAASTPEIRSPLRGSSSGALGLRFAGLARSRWAGEGTQGNPISNRLASSRRRC